MTAGRSRKLASHPTKLHLEVLALDLLPAHLLASPSILRSVRTPWSNKEVEPKGATSVWAGRLFNPCLKPSLEAPRHPSAHEQCGFRVLSRTNARGSFAHVCCAASRISRQSSRPSRNACKDDACGEETRRTLIVALVSDTQGYSRSFTWPLAASRFARALGR